MFAPGASRWLAAGLVAIVAGFAIEFGVLAARAPLVSGVLSGAVAAWLFFAVFLRDPERRVGEGLVSAADGRVKEVRRDGDVWVVSVFMNVADVHVNRFPVAASVERVESTGSGYRPAYRPDAFHNVQRRYVLRSALGTVEVVQMTGILARRLVSFVGPGDARTKGERLGMIVLGSRVDVRFPAARATPIVRPGDRVRAGASSIARELPAA